MGGGDIGDSWGGSGSSIEDFLSPFSIEVFGLGRKVVIFLVASVGASVIVVVMIMRDDDLDWKSNSIFFRMLIKMIITKKMKINLIIHQKKWGVPFNPSYLQQSCLIEAVSRCVNRSVQFVLVLVFEAFLAFVFTSGAVLGSGEEVIVVLLKEQRSVASWVFLIHNSSAPFADVVYLLGLEEWFFVVVVVVLV